MAATVVYLSNGDCCATRAKGIEMRDEREALRSSGKYVRRRVSSKQNATLACGERVNNSPDTDEAGSAGYNLYDHVPTSLYTSSGTNSVVKMRLFANDTE